MKSPLLIACFLMVLPFLGVAQNVDFQVREKAVLDAAWCGGLNACQFGRLDLDGDGKKDLVVFDRHGNRLSCFLNRGARGEICYVCDNAYASCFPNLTDWAIFVDYDGDGYEDIFTYSKGWAGMKVYRNIGTEKPEFELVVSPYLTSWQAGGEVNIIATNADYPAIADLDGDGDVDILTFGVLGTFIEKHVNRSMERFGNGDSLVFEKTDYCWGRVAESEENNEMYLDTCLFGKSLIVNQEDFRHRGATFAVPDLTGNGLRDLILADVDYPGLTFLQNGGSAGHALMVSQETHFPQNEPVYLFSMPVPFFTDIDNDGIEDMLVSPFDPNPMVCEGRHSVWLYLNQGTNQRPEFHLFTKSFLQDQMIDVGTGSFPAFVDANGDGLTDLVVGTIGDIDSTYYNYGTLYVHRTAQLAMYQNVGTKQNPVFQLVDNDFGDLGSLKYSGLVPAFGDLNGDGRFEMLVGTSEGNLLFFDADFNLLDDDYLNFGKTWSAPFLVDVNRDGILDLIVGNADGKLSYFQGIRNGEETQFNWVSDFWGGIDVRDYATSYYGYSIPTLFEVDEELLLAVGSEQGKMFLFNNISDNLNGSFTNITAHWEDYVGGFENRFGMRTASALADLNADGGLEMVVGNFCGGVELVGGAIPVNQGVDDKQDVKLSVFPVPARNVVYLSCEAEINQVFVTDLLGRNVNVPIEKTQFIQLDVSDLPHGCYVVSVHFSDGMVSTRKIVVV